MPEPFSLYQGVFPVSREPELAALRAALDAARRGRLAVTLLSGDPGMGKSTLLDAITDEARRSGMTVLRGAAFDAEGMPPYLPFLEALGGYVRHSPPEVLRAQVGEQEAVLAEVLPELLARLGDAPVSYPLPAEQARLRLFDAVAIWLGEIAQDAPLALVLDDLHWTDPASCDLLRYLARRVRDRPIAVLGAFRPAEGAQHPALQRTLAALDQARVLTVVTVAPLSPTGTALLAEQFLGADVHADLASTLHAQSEGTPFIAEELLRAWRTDGSLALRDQVWRLIQEPAEAISPPSVMRVVQQRLGQLRREDLAILQIAAVAGREFAPAIVAAAGEVGVEAVMSVMDHAASLRLVQPLPGGEMFGFHHEAIRSGILREINIYRRQHLHGALGRALEASGAVDDPRGLAEVAFHFSHSTERALGAHYAFLAGHQSLRASAFEEARRQFALTLALLPADDDRRGDVLLGHGESASLAGNEAEAMASLSAAQSWFQARGDDRAAHAAHHLGRVAWRQEQTELARTAFRVALAIMGESDSAERVEALVDLGTLQAVSDGDLAAGLRHVREAVTRAEALEDLRLLAIARRALGNLLVRTNDLQAGIALLEDALTLAVATGDLTEAAECCACLAPACWWQGDIARSDAVTRQRLAFALTTHDRFQLRHVYPWLGVCAGIRGRIAEAVAEFSRAEEVIAGLESPEPRAYLSFARGALALMTGDLPQARMYLDEALAIFRTLGGAAGWYEGFGGLLDFASGDLVAAHEALANLAALVERLPAGAMAAGEPLVCAAQLALDLNDRERYPAMLGLLERYPGQFHDFLVDRLRGEIALRLGDLPAAQSLLIASERQARVASLLWELVRIHEAQADLALAQGPDKDQARALLAEAQTLAARIGGRREADRLQARLETMGVSSHGISGLTAREVEVLSCLARGQSNRAIADALFLAPKTIEHHLTSIYTKLQVENRAQAAAFAVRHGLV
jgi:DNA-binding CsgD family transcriptional regulator